MTIDTRYTTVGLVAFVDLLGFSARVASVETSADLKALERDVRRVQKLFDHASQDEVVRDVQKLQAKKVLAFSDCLVIAVPSFSPLAGSEGDFDVQLGEVLAMAYAQGRCALNGIFVRGGADYGLWHKRKDTIISPAMVEAYNLERKTVVPMIGVSEELIRHFRDHPHRKHYHESDDPFPKYFKKVKLPNGSRTWVLDYLLLYLGEVDGTLTARSGSSTRSRTQPGRRSCAP